MRFGLTGSVAWLSIWAITALCAAGEEPAPTRPFEEWLADLRAEAVTLGLKPETVDRALAGVAPLPEVVERDRAQPEELLSLGAYIDRELSAGTVRSARALAQSHAALLRRVQRAYGVPPEILIAIWGIESRFGRNTGDEPTVPALVTLAYEGRRAARFRSEIFDALRILDGGRVTSDQMKGSWAGAMGQPQFLPSSYLRFAVDFDGDGRADIWRSEADVFASLANYLKEHGWVGSERWGREVRVGSRALEQIDAAIPRRGAGCKAEREMTQARPLIEWRKLGVTLINGKRLPSEAAAASLVRVEDRRFLVYRNYDVILRYNCAHAYALGVGLLSDRVTGR